MLSHKHATPLGSRTATGFPRPLAIHLIGSPMLPTPKPAKAKRIEGRASLYSDDPLPASHNPEALHSNLYISFHLQTSEIERGGSNANRGAEAHRPSLSMSPSSTPPGIGYAGQPFLLTAATDQERSTSDLRSSSHWLTCCSRLSVLTSALHGPATTRTDVGS